MKIPNLKIKVRKPGTRPLLKIFLVLAAVGATCLLGAFFGAYMSVKDSLPSISGLESLRAKAITSIYSDKDELVKEFAQERRIEVPLSGISRDLINAIIATEDPRFFRHKGVDYLGILRALWEDVRKVGKGNLHGGSTITQQLIRNLFLYSQQKFRRKLKEIFLARKVERAYSKEKILEMYCNQFYLGHGVYGVEAASNLYFGKSASDLSLEEAALIAGIFRGPSLYSPYNNTKLTLQRRNHVLNRLAEERYITKAVRDAAKARPMIVLPLRKAGSEYGAYYFEEIRRYIEKNYGSEALYGAGLKIYTSFNAEFQKYAEEAVSRGLRVQDKKYGWRRDKKNLIAEGKTDLMTEDLRSWSSNPIRIGDIWDAVVLDVERSEAEVRIKNMIGRMNNKEIEWTGGMFLTSLIKRGDVIQVRVNSIDPSGRELQVSLDQEPLVESAFVAENPATGEIKAMVGGQSFLRSQFNRATQAMRQTGSVIKPFLYTAAIENGYTPASIIIDEPMTFTDKWGGQPWTPRNYDRKFKGAVTLRKGLEESRNVVTARMLEYISPQTGVNYCRRFGITSTLYPYLSLSLGTFEVTLLELVSGFSTFPNKGVRVLPHFIRRIEDQDGNVLEEHRVESEEVVSPQTAYIMTHMMEGVMKPGGGTAWQAASLNWPLAGKTGTTDDYTDAWFIGFSPKLVAGVWVGFDEKVSLGTKQSGAAAALPIWLDFFGKVIDAKGKEARARGEELVPEEFEVPPNLVFVDIDSKTGLLAGRDCRFVLREVFLPGTEPSRYCTNRDHLRILDYYSQDEAKEEH